MPEPEPPAAPRPSCLHPALLGCWEVYTQCRAWAPWRIVVVLVVVLVVLLLPLLVLLVLVLPLLLPLLLLRHVTPFRYPIDPNW